MSVAFIKKIKLGVSIFIVLSIVLSCGETRDFPAVKKLEEYKATEFLPTLEHKIDAKKNSVYCATLLFCWEEIRKEIGSSIEVDKSFSDLILLNDSRSFLNVLKSDEYKTGARIEEGMIQASAEFTKSLPFGVKLHSYDKRLKFNGEAVSSFGLSGFDNDMFEVLEIGYYKNDENFIVKLLPKDTAHEIILFASESKFTTLAEMSKEVEKLIELGKKESQNSKKAWKYSFNVDDELVIPKFKFNIETNFKKLEGSTFRTVDRGYQIETAWQRTAFILDELGAEIESEAVVVATDSCSSEEPAKPKPKHLVFDHAFSVFLKRTDARNPYFGMWVANTELMLVE